MRTRSGRVVGKKTASCYLCRKTKQNKLGTKETKLRDGRNDKDNYVTH